jgi:hypothetical protein
MRTHWEQQKSNASTLPPKTKPKKKKREAWMPWVDATSPHWQQELFCIIVFFAIFCQGKAMNYMGCT